MLNATPIHRSANRTNLFMGGDREMVMLSGLLAAALIFASMNWFAAIIGVFLWISCLYLLRLMAKSDPKMRQVYLRHIKYAAYYPARSTPFRINQGKPYR